MKIKILIVVTFLYICLAAIYFNGTFNNFKMKLPFGNYTSKIHAHMTGGRQTTLIEDLAFETFESGDTANDIILEFLKEDSIIERTEDCWAYFTQHVIPVAATLNISEHTPKLGMSHTVHKEIGIFEMMMSLFYHPRNSHCIYIDQKADSKIFQAVNGIVKCYREIFLQDCNNCGSLIVMEKTFPLIWGDVSIIEADLICMNRLLEENEDWNFYLNSAGSELPLMTLDHVSESLTDSIVQSFKLPNRERLKDAHALYRHTFNLFDLNYQKTGLIKAPPPLNVTIMKGTRYVVLKRDFAQFLATNPISMKFYNWIIDMPSGDESYFSTLATFVVLDDGTVIQDLKKNTAQGQCTRSVLWYYQDCKGKTIRSICNLGVEDLPKTRKSSCLIANKFNLAVSPAAPLLQWLHIAQQYPHFKTNFTLTQIFDNTSLSLGHGQL